MPNSDGCVHGHPTDIEAVVNDLLSLGVVVNENPFSSTNYPYATQGIISVYIDDEV